MQGRYFMDTLNKFLLVTVLVLSLISVFIFYLPVKLIFVAVELALLGWFIFRCLMVEKQRGSVESWTVSGGKACANNPYST